MKMFLYTASVPLALFVLFYGLPRLFAELFNSHSDVGLIAMVILACGIVGVLASKIYNVVKKELNHEDA